MSNEKTKEVGVIGQMYEERKSKRLGVLESREEKYKTLLMRDPEGKSFNITYSTFHSSWRKYQGEVVAQTSTQVEEKRAEQKEKVEKAKSTLKKEDAKPKLSSEDKVKAVHAASEIVLSIMNKYGLELNMVTSVRGAIQIKTGRRTLVEIWKKFTAGKYDICVLQDVADKVHTDMDLDVSVHDAWRLKTVYSIADKDFKAVLDVLMTAIKDYMTKEEEK
jgi:hypothetical protein